MTNEREERKDPQNCFLECEEKRKCSGKQAVQILPHIFNTCEKRVCVCVCVCGKTWNSTVIYTHNQLNIPPTLHRNSLPILKAFSDALLHFSVQFAQLGGGGGMGADTRVIAICPKKKKTKQNKTTKEKERKNNTLLPPSFSLCG